MAYCDILKDHTSIVDVLDMGDIMPVRRKPSGAILGTVAELLCPLGDADLHEQLEQYRIAYEKEHGPTDLTRRYTSMWPARERDFLFKHDPKAFWDGLPPFCKAYLRKQVSAAAIDGDVDDLPEAFIELYSKGLLQVGNEKDEIDPQGDRSR